MIRRPLLPSGTMLWFDLDDTVWDMSGNSVICLRELYDSQNLGRWFSSPIEWDEIYHSVNRELWERYSRGEISRDFLRSERFARPLRIAGANDDDALKMSELLDRLYLDSLGQKTALLPGARLTLDILADRGYRLGIVSNGFREVQYNKLRSSEIEGYFDPVVLSDDAGVNKPDRRFFKYAEERARSANMHNIIIGDNFTTDITGALAAGWSAIWLENGGRKPDFVIPDNTEIITGLPELTELFQGVLGPAKLEERASKNA